MSESDYASDDTDDTVSAGYAFNLPQYNLRGLRVFVGPRRRASVEDIRDDTSRMEWEVGHEDNKDDGQQIDLGLDRGFIGRRNPLSKQIGQATDLALRMIETQKSTVIMTAMAKRLVADSPRAVNHITPQSTWGGIQTLVRLWVAKLRKEEFFKMQLVHLGGSNSGANIRAWCRFASQTPATLADYHPHNAGLIKIDVKIVEKLAYHASSSHADSLIERQKCIFHIANLIINQVQWLWVAFLAPEQSNGGAEQPVAVHSDATAGLLKYCSHPSAGYHWDAEFFGGIVRMYHKKDNPSTEFNQDGGFGRVLSIGDAYLDRADGTEQLIAINSITRCTSYGKHALHWKEPLSENP